MRKLFALLVAVSLAFSALSGVVPVFEMEQAQANHANTCGSVKYWWNNSNVIVTYGTSNCHCDGPGRRIAAEIASDGFGWNDSTGTKKITIKDVYGAFYSRTWSNTEFDQKKHRYIPAGVTEVYSIKFETSGVWTYGDLRLKWWCTTQTPGSYIYNFIR